MYGMALGFVADTDFVLQKHIAKFDFFFLICITKGKLFAHAFILSHPTSKQYMPLNT